MSTYTVQYIDGKGQIRVEEIWAVNPGHAFLKCKRAHPNSRLVKCFKEGRSNGGYGRTEWEAPKNQELLPVTRRSRYKQLCMDRLLDEAESYMPNISPLQYLRR